MDAHHHPDDGKTKWSTRKPNSTPASKSWKEGFMLGVLFTVLVYMLMGKQSSKRAIIKEVL